ncbi:PhoX family protein [Streptomyces sp. 15-116A]|uniref:PhoX family protein n=1 Tax=Streptomyces sp. 15-116A TaxID=2259035 RepID=UPI0021B2B28D|nr:PhoX family protein [Streptomyces sp. 15-116A]MCT7351420.1 PhoX family protein [Streptomyces sp. 15-116A]
MTFQRDRGTEVESLGALVFHMARHHGWDGEVLLNYGSVEFLGPYGALGSPDANGIRLPAGFTSRVIARSGQRVTGTSYTWHNAPDGGACYADGSGWIYVSNSEINPSGGAGAVKFSATGAITGAYRILSGTRQNCAGGKTPWNTWLSCEEVDRGYVYETDPWGVKAAVRRDAMGRFKHEAAAADPVRKVVYLTEDVSDGCFYRFRPTTWGDLSSGTLEVLVAGSGTSGPVSWARVPDPSGATATRNQVSGAKRFNGGEGCYYADDTCWFTTKGDNRVWQYNAAAQTIELAYDDSLVTGGTAPLTGVDNVTGSSSGDLFVAEDGGNMEICVITPDDVVAPFLRIDGQSGSEITGPAFSPDGSRLYFSSQRGTSGSSSGGITYEVRGPFRS